LVALQGKCWSEGSFGEQCRHQKLIEECPAPGLSPATRALLHDSARRLAAHLRYRGAGTVEFRVDTASAGDPATVVFLEINARIRSSTR